MNTFITREEAQKWLDSTTVRRNIKRKVRQYADMMDNGQWYSDVAPPIFLEIGTNEVLDGNNRLTAFLKSNLEVFESEVRYVPRDHIWVLDTGTSRSLEDTAMLSAHPNSRERSSLFNTAAYWARGRVSGFTRIEQMEWLRDNPHTDDATKFAARVRTGYSSAMVKIPIGIAATLWDIAAWAEGGEFVEQFIDELSTNQLADHDLQNRLMRLDADRRNRAIRTSINQNQWGLILVRSYTAWFEGDSISRLYARRNNLQNLNGWNKWFMHNWDGDA